MNIYIALCYCLEKQINNSNVDFSDLSEAMSTETNSYIISKSDIKS